MYFDRNSLCTKTLSSYSRSKSVAESFPRLGLTVSLLGRPIAIPPRIKGAVSVFWQREDGTYKMGKEKIPNPSVTFIAKEKDWVAICHDQLSGRWAYVTGRLKVRGDQVVAGKVGEMFPQNFTSAATLT